MRASALVNLISNCLQLKRPVLAPCRESLTGPHKPGEVPSPSWGAPAFGRVLVSISRVVFLPFATFGLDPEGAASLSCDIKGDLLGIGEL